MGEHLKNGVTDVPLHNLLEVHVVQLIMDEEPIDDGRQVLERVQREVDVCRLRELVAALHAHRLIVQDLNLRHGCFSLLYSMYDDFHLILYGISLNHYIFHFSLLSSIGTDPRSGFFKGLNFFDQSPLLV